MLLHYIECLGVRNLSTFVQIKNDPNRINLLNQLYNASHINEATLNNTLSYIDHLYLPAQPMYCTTYNHTLIPSCVIRVGNLLMYPVISHAGWYKTPSSTRYTKCNCSFVNNHKYKKIFEYYCSKYCLHISAGKCS